MADGQHSWILKVENVQGLSDCHKANLFILSELNVSENSPCVLPDDSLDLLQELGFKAASSFDC
ncbi:MULTISPECIES: hypothetical protein [unclassified Prochlorococcus]|uniref:hypothetical protein n=1 Tax=Prochlorococcus sp. MIT 0718 TaxID=3082539 RepID=UPI00053399CA|nr:hypothetical protein EV12_2262 [Prochlorococcus sp. MIT 0701]KGG26346.1 hypothetical protein EV13_2478 [Prochlorococcus sp. MIT 0702]KGG31236.1 hypothetical protein EV14_2608 [Prochlorococcus sp. MIT 0703]